MLTILERFNRLEGLNLTFIGDGNNVAVSLLHACAILGLNFTLASPEGYDLPSEALSLAHRLAQGTTVRTLRDPHEAADGAHVLYTDTWVSMGQEEETSRRLDIFPPYQLNDHLLHHADPSAIVMHCLPAHRGQEITDEVMDGPQSAVFQQAENRLHAQKAILLHLLIPK
jgi:ornithine carbamoyltransferase